MTTLGRHLAVILLLPFLLYAAPGADAGPPIGLQEPYLHGRTVHLPVSHDAINLAVPRTHAGHLELLGPAAGGRGWVVVDSAEAPRIKVLVATARHSRTIRISVDETNSTSYRLSSDKKQVVEVSADRDGGFLTAVAFDLTGDVLEKRRFRGYGGLLDLDDGKAVVSTDVGTFMWSIGGRARKVAGPSQAASLSAGVLFVETGADVGPTGLDDPGTPAWTDPEFAPRAVSGDGEVVVGLRDGQLEARRVKNGETRSVMDAAYRAGDPLFLTNAPMFKRLHVVVHKGRRTAITTCKISSGSCTRQTDWRRGRLTLPFQTPYFGESA